RRKFQTPTDYGCRTWPTSSRPRRAVRRRYDVGRHNPFRMIALLSMAETLQAGVIHGIDKFITGEASAELAKDVLCQPPHVPIGDLEQNAEDRITQRITQSVRRETPLDLHDEAQQPQLSRIVKRHAMSQRSVPRQGARQ